MSRELKKGKLPEDIARRHGITFTQVVEVMRANDPYGLDSLSKKTSPADILESVKAAMAEPGIYEVNILPEIMDAEKVTIEFSGGMKG